MSILASIETRLDKETWQETYGTLPLSAKRQPRQTALMINGDGAMFLLSAHLLSAASDRTRESNCWRLKGKSNKRATRESAGAGAGATPIPRGRTCRVALPTIRMANTHSGPLKASHGLFREPLHSFLPPAKPPGPFDTATVIRPALLMHNYCTP